MRLRLDSVHRKTDLPILPADTYDPESIAEEAAMEEQALLEEMGIDFTPAARREVWCLNRKHGKQFVGLSPLQGHSFIARCMRGFWLMQMCRLWI